MGALGELLELLHDAHSSLSSYEVEFQDWRPAPPSSNELTVSYSPGGQPQLSWRGAGPFPKAILRKHRFWFVPPDHLRVENSEGEGLVRLAVRNGPQWWLWSDELGTISGSAEPDDRGAIALPPMFSPTALEVRRLITTMRFEPAGTSERAGRAVVCARARPRRQPAARGELSYEFEFDAEHGSLLRRAEFEEGECVWERQAREVLYDAEIDPGCFVFVSPDGSLPREVALPTPAPSARRSGATVWFTGIEEGDETTPARSLEQALSARGLPARVLDADTLRRGLSSDLGASPADRAEQTRRAAHVAAFLADSGALAIVALPSESGQDSRHASEVHAEMGVALLEVPVDTPVPQIIESLTTPPESRGAP